MDLQEVIQSIAELKSEIKSKDAIIEKLEVRVEKLESSNVQVLLSNERILMKMDSLDNKMSAINEYIEQQKNQPIKDKHDFIKSSIQTIVNIAIGGMIGYLTSRK